MVDAHNYFAPLLLLFSKQPSDENFGLDGPRYNPLDDFKRYRGGYSVDNDDYWASLAFLGIWGYAIAAIILVVGTIWVIVNFFRLGFRCFCRCFISPDDPDQEVCKNMCPPR